MLQCKAKTNFARVGKIWKKKPAVTRPDAGLKLATKIQTSLFDFSVDSTIHSETQSVEHYNPY